MKNKLAKKIISMLLTSIIFISISNELVLANTIETKALTNIDILDYYEFNLDETVTYKLKGEKEIRYYVTPLPTEGRLDIEIEYKNIKETTLSVRLWGENKEVWKETPTNESGKITKTIYPYKGSIGFLIEGGSIQGGEIKFKFKFYDGNVTEVEPNEGVWSATKIQVNDNQRGILMNRNDRDYFEFNLEEPGYVDLKTITYGNEDIEFMIFEKGRVNIAADFQSRGGTWDNGVQTNHSVYLEKGDYYLGIITLEPYSGKYDFNIQYNTINDINEYEPNNKPIDANPIKIGENIKGIMMGYFDGEDNIDYFKVNIPSKTQLNLEAINKNPTAYKLSILDSSNKEVFNKEVSENTSSEINPITLEAGDYYIKITSDKNLLYEFKLFQNGYKDIESHWAKREIESFIEKGYLDTSKSDFRPNDSITRAEFIKIVNKAFGYKEKVESEKFIDINKKQWWYNEILIAIKAGYIDTKQTKFRPNDSITREEAAAILTTIKNNKDKKIDKLKEYKDYDKVSAWAQSSVEGAIKAGYMGKNTTKFNPKNNITRAESIVTLYRVTIE